MGCLLNQLRPELVMFGTYLCTNSELIISTCHLFQEKVAYTITYIRNVPFDMELHSAV
jgi:hypothetical protein